MILVQYSSSIEPFPVVNLHSITNFVVALFLLTPRLLQTSEMIKSANIMFLPVTEEMTRRRMGSPFMNPLATLYLGNYLIN